MKWYTKSMPQNLKFSEQCMPVQLDNLFFFFTPLCFILGIKNCILNWKKITVDIFNDIYSSNNIADKRCFSCRYASLWPSQLGKYWAAWLPQSLPACFLTRVVSCAIPASKQTAILLPFSAGGTDQALLHSPSCVTSLLDKCVRACLGGVI